MSCPKCGELMTKEPSDTAWVCSKCESVIQDEDLLKHKNKGERNE